MNVKRKLLIVLLSLGTLVGYGAMFARIHCTHHSWHSGRTDFERHVADVCTDAALRARAERPSAPPP